MIQENPIDMSTRKKNPKKDITNSTLWRSQHMDRLAAWEMLCRYIRNEHGTPMSNRDLCDRIALPKALISKIIQSLRDKLNG